MVHCTVLTDFIQGFTKHDSCEWCYKPCCPAVAFITVCFSYVIIEKKINDDDDDGDDDDDDQVVTGERYYSRHLVTLKNFNKTIKCRQKQKQLYSN